jgi:hypothetical protein
VLNSEKARDLSLHLTEARRVLERTGRVLETHVEELFPFLLEAILELVVRQLPQVNFQGSLPHA